MKPMNYNNAIYANAYTDLIHDASKVCWNQPAETTREGKLAYNLRRVKTGHESVLEHSNIVIDFVLPFTLENVTEISELLVDNKFLWSKAKFNEDYIRLVLSGSIRGYKELFRRTQHLDTRLAKNIKECLYTASDKEYFNDFIQAGIMDEERFNNTYANTVPNRLEPISDKIDIVNIDDIEYIYSILKDDFSYDDILDLATVTIAFKDMSRSCTHQLVRHRNAITQESQRYVDYSKAGFTSPSKYKDEYKDTIYNIVLGDHYSFNLTMEELGSMLISIYPQLREQGVSKEDARAFLPTNVQCGVLYMTFTIRNLIKFLELRTEISAQAEIREYANIIYEQITKSLNPIIGEIYKYLIPKYVLVEIDYSYDNIDEIVEELITEE